MPEYALVLVVETHASGASVVVLNGDLDFHTAPRLRRTVETLPLEAGTPLILDASGLTFCDSIGVTALISAYQRAQAAAAPFAVTGSNRDLNHVFEITGVDRLFALHPDVAAAAAALGGPHRPADGSGGHPG